MTKHNEDKDDALPYFVQGKNILHNVMFDNGYVFKHSGYRNFNEMVRNLRSMNKQLKKLGIEASYTVTLPIKDK